MASCTKAYNGCGTNNICGRSEFTRLSFYVLHKGLPTTGVALTTHVAGANLLAVVVLRTHERQILDAPGSRARTSHVMVYDRAAVVGGGGGDDAWTDIVATRHCDAATRVTPTNPRGLR